MAFAMHEHVACPPEKAFDLMADARNEAKWNSQVSSSELLSGEPVGPGSRFRTVNRREPYDATITEYDRPNRLGFEVSGKRMDISATFTFAEDDGGTELDGSFDFRPKGFVKVMFPLLAPMIRRDLPKQAASFKALCEGQNSSPTTTTGTLCDSAPRPQLVHAYPACRDPGEPQPTSAGRGQLDRRP